MKITYSMIVLIISLLLPPSLPCSTSTSSSSSTVTVTSKSFTCNNCNNNVNFPTAHCPLAVIKNSNLSSMILLLRGGGGDETDDDDDDDDDDVNDSDIDAYVEQLIAGIDLTSSDDDGDNEIDIENGIENDKENENNNDEDDEDLNKGEEKKSDSYRSNSMNSSLDGTKIEEQRQEGEEREDVKVKAEDDVQANGENIVESQIQLPLRQSQNDHEEGEEHDEHDDHDEEEEYPLQRQEDQDSVKINDDITNNVISSKEEDDDTISNSSRKDGDSISDASNAISTSTRTKSTKKKKRRKNGKSRGKKRQVDTAINNNIGKNNDGTSNDNNNNDDDENINPAIEDEKEESTKVSISPQPSKVESEPTIDATATNKNEENAKMQTTTKEQQQKQQQQQPPPPPLIKPPNSIQRFLLHKGQIGRSITTLSILIYEFISYYLPELYALCAIIRKKFFPEPQLSNRYGPYNSKNNNHKGQGPPTATIPKVHSQYAAFTSSNSSLGGKKISTAQKKVLDQIALDKLKQVTKASSAAAVKGGKAGGSGGVGEYNEGGKYTHLSLTFMKRYNLGHFAQEKKMFDRMIGVLGDADEDHKKGGISHNGSGMGMKSDDEIEEGESDTSKFFLEGKEGRRNEEELEEHGEEMDDESEDWVAQAFLDQDNKEDIGIDDFYGDYEKDREARKNLDIIEAAYASKDEVSSRKNVKSIKSDKDGGAGMLGRLRAVGANSVSSRIFGAYPGDAVSIEDAGSANGVMDLAMKYGYGDWSDDFDDDDDDNGVGGEDFHNNRGLHKKRSRGRGSSSKTKRRKRKRQSASRSKPLSDESDSGFSVSFDFGAPSKITFNAGRTSTQNRRKRKISHRENSSRNPHRRPPGQEIAITKRRRDPDHFRSPRTRVKKQSSSIISSTRVQRPSVHRSKEESLSQRQKEILKGMLEYKKVKSKSAKSDESE